MKMKTMVILTLLLMLTSTVSLASNSLFVHGIVDGHEAEVILDDRGGNGGAFDALVYVDARGTLLHGSPQGIMYRKVSVVGDGSDLRAFFDAGKIYITNAVYLPGECHACSRNTSAQEFGFEHGKLTSEGVVTVADPPLLTVNATEKLRQSIVRAFATR